MDKALKYCGNCTFSEAEHKAVKQYPNEQVLAVLCPTAFWQDSPGLARLREAVETEQAKLNPIMRDVREMLQARRGDDIKMSDGELRDLVLIALSAASPVQGEKKCGKCREPFHFTVQTSVNDGDICSDCAPPRTAANYAQREGAPHVE